MAIPAKDSVQTLGQSQEMLDAIKKKFAEDVNEATAGAIEEVKVNGTAVPVTDKSVDITVPTKTSELENDSNFATTAEIPTKVSQLTNDSNFQTNVLESVKVNGAVLPVTAKSVDVSVPTKVSQLTNDANYTPEEDVGVFAATLKANGWTNTDGVYTQTVDCAGMKAAYDTDAPQVLTTGVRDTDGKRKTALGVLTQGDNSGETLDGKIKWTCYSTPPTVDLPILLRRAKVITG